jgi:acyl dehydratase
MTRVFTITEDLIRAYSRRGNYHSDPETASALGLGGLVAQGMQAAGPAYAELLDTWGEEFLAQGEIDLRFVGPVYAGDTVDATTTFAADATATLEVANVTAGRIAVVGSARRS